MSYRDVSTLNRLSELSTQRRASSIPRYRDTKIQRYRDTEIQRYRDTKIQQMVSSFVLLQNGLKKNSRRIRKDISIKISTETFAWRKLILSVMPPIFFCRRDAISKSFTNDSVNTRTDTFSKRFNLFIIITKN